MLHLAVCIRMCLDPARLPINDFFNHPLKRIDALDALEIFHRHASMVLAVFLLGRSDSIFQFLAHVGCIEFELRQGSVGAALELVRDRAFLVIARLRLPLLLVCRPGRV